MRGDAKLSKLRRSYTDTDDLKKGRQKLFDEVQEDKTRL